MPLIPPALSHTHNPHNPAPDLPNNTNDVPAQPIATVTVPSDPASLPPLSAIPTSVALSRDWVVVGLANSRIHIFSAKTGVLGRTLVGHSAGVWAVGLVTGSGPDEHGFAPKSSGKAREAHPDDVAEGEVDHLQDISREEGEWESDDDEVEQAGPSSSKPDKPQYRISSTLRVALGLDSSITSPKRKRKSMPDGFGSPPRSSLDSNLGATE